MTAYDSPHIYLVHAFLLMLDLVVFKSCPVVLLIFLSVDGHHKLIRWKLVTHGAIDGYSRKVLYLKCSNNNRASTVYDLFLEAVYHYGLPSRVRSDQGTENVLVAQHMIEHTGAIAAACLLAVLCIISVLKGCGETCARV